MAKIAIIEAKPSRINYEKQFDNSFEFDRYALCSDSSVKRVLKKDVDIEFNPDDYEWIILVGADPCKYFLKGINVTDHSGQIAENKWIPVINPAMVTFKPEIKLLWEESRDSIIGYVTGVKTQQTYEDAIVRGITSKKDAIEFLQAALASNNKFFGLDSETSSLYPRNGYVLGVSISFERDHGAYIDANIIDDDVSALIQKLILEKLPILHNAKFDIPWFRYHFGWVFSRFEDTMLLHYCLDENPGTHGLKQLAIKYTKYGDYERPLYEWMEKYRKENGVLKDDFSFEVIPFEVMYPYAAIDAIVTFLIYLKLKPAVNKNDKLKSVYDKILIPGSKFLMDMENNGVPFDKDRLSFAQKILNEHIDNAVAKLYEDPRISEFEAKQGKPFNPGSVMQLRALLFDHLGIRPTGKRTDTGAHSTDAEVLQILAEQHELPGKILEIRKKTKIKNTYIDKIIPALDRDSRLRTNFNIHGTTSGRLSSSGKFNMQTLPRDDAAVKGAIKARDGWNIVSCDLETGEVYIAAALSGDKKLQQVFIDGEDFHGSIAKLVFNLDCPASEVKKKYPLLRQASKAITFSLFYGSGPDNVSETVNKEAKANGLDYHFSVEEAKEAMQQFMNTFKTFAKWMTREKEEIAKKGYVYTFFGRKRRVPNVLSADPSVRAHAIRSAFNAEFQGPCSDVNLLAAIEMNDYIKEAGMGAKIFALVHDSILAEVPDIELDHYKMKLKEFLQRDRGLSIPGRPIGCDFEIHKDYSMGKFEKQYAGMV